MVHGANRHVLALICRNEGTQHDDWNARIPLAVLSLSFWAHRTAKNDTEVQLTTKVEIFGTFMVIGL